MGSFWRDDLSGEALCHPSARQHLREASQLLHLFDVHHRGNLWLWGQSKDRAKAAQGPSISFPLLPPTRSRSHAQSLPVLQSTVRSFRKSPVPQIFTKCLTINHHSYQLSAKVEIFLFDQTLSPAHRPECDPKGSMAFLQNQFRCPPMLGARRT